MSQVEFKNIRKTFWYREGLQFQCRRCQQCCGGEPGYIWVSPDGIQAMADCIGMDVESFAFEYVRRVGSRLSLKEKEGGFCVMHAESGCRVYDARPPQCIAYPFWTAILRSRDTWDAEAANCPGMNQGEHHCAEDIHRRTWRSS